MLARAFFGACLVLAVFARGASSSEEEAEETDAADLPLAFEAGFALPFLAAAGRFARGASSSDERSDEAGWDLADLEGGLPLLVPFPFAWDYDVQLLSLHSASPENLGFHDTAWPRWTMEYTYRLVIIFITLHHAPPNSSCRRPRLLRERLLVLLIRARYPLRFARTALLAGFSIRVETIAFFVRVLGMNVGHMRCLKSRCGSKVRRDHCHGC